jgi:hypothetical protein
MNPNRMSCGEVREKLPLYMGADLDAEVLEAVRGHLDLCSECARRAGWALGARRELVAAFRAREADVARPGLWSGIRATLHTEGLIHGDEKADVRPVVLRASRGRWSSMSWALAPLAAAAVLLLVLQVAGEFGSGPGRGPNVLPNPNGPGVSPPTDVVDMPVSYPLGGGLQQSSTLQPINARDVSPLPAPYLPRRGSRAPAVGDTSLAGYNRIK